MLRWLELTPDYRCNNRCVGCYSVQDAGPSMDAREALAALADGRRQGARSLWLGGGEPTLRKDLLALVAAARRLGYDTVKLQTNGMLLAYPEFARRCADAGVTEVNLALKSHDPATHDRLTRTPGCHALLERGIENARALGLALAGDVLVYRETAPALPDLVRHYAPRGLAHFNVWLLSAIDATDRETAAQVPRLADVVPYVTAAMDLGLATVTSLHTPPCTVPATHRACLFSAADLGLLVVNPGGHSFRLERSPIEGGRYLPGCDACALRPRCNGVRDDYVRVHGSAEFAPVVEA